MTKPKVGVLTLNGYYNYGNRLQNYALEQTINKLGFQAETIRINRFAEQTRADKIRSVGSLGVLFRILWNKIYPNNYRNRIENERKRSFLEFSKQYINESDFVLSQQNVPESIASDYTYFIVGSDQVWNPGNLHGTDFYFLRFANKGQRISYSASFGVSNIQPEDMDNYIEWLNGMDYISVREEAGKKIVQDLTNREAIVHVDPTMLLTKEEWLRLSKKADNRPEEKYILTYFLNEPNDEAKIQIEKSKSDGYQIINLAKSSESETYKTGPCEFIDYIDNASLFLTDSFHGVAFSVILNTPFLVYKRQGSNQSMYSRIETILNKFNLESRAGETFDGKLYEVDFNHVSEILEEEKQKSIEYLKIAMKVD